MRSNAKPAPGAADRTGDRAERAAGMENIGARLRAVRKGRGETLMAVAGRTGISVSALSKIENGKMSPTFGNLMKLAEGLRISLSDLVAAGMERRASVTRMAVTRADEIEYRRTPGYDVGPLCTEFAGKRMTPFIERVRARYPLSAEPHISHGGEEFIHVLSGSIDVLAGGGPPVRLSRGDSAYLDSRMAHTYVTVGEEEAEILMVWLSPFGGDAATPVDAAEAMLNGKP